MVEVFMGLSGGMTAAGALLPGACRIALSPRRRKHPIGAERSRIDAVKNNGPAEKIDRAAKGCCYFLNRY
jgi:hypothetical protein